jgi:hypothetical protein
VSVREMTVALRFAILRWVLLRPSQRPGVLPFVVASLVWIQHGGLRADETTTGSDWLLQSTTSTFESDSEFSTFLFTPSTPFEPTEPNSLFTAGAGRIGRASYQSSDPEEGPVINEDGLERIGPADFIDGEPIVIPPMPGESRHVSDNAAATASTYNPEDVESLNDLNKGEPKLNLRRLAGSPYQNYRVDESFLSWIPGSGDDFGWFSLVGSTYQPRGKTSGFSGTINIHWLGGPTTAPLSPRLYDFAMGYQTRDSLSHRFSYDLAASVGAYSDFEGSARDGIRFPAHAIGMVHYDQSTDLVFGVDYLDRDDYSILPVFGLSLHNFDLPGLRMDLIFPRPRIEYTLSPDSRAYLSGQLGGGTWAVEFPDEREHAMTYRDYRLILGFERASEGNYLGALEFGYIFGRRLEFRDLSTQSFDDAFLIQWVIRR